MKALTAKGAKHGFGRLIDLTRADPVAVAKQGRPVVVVMAVEEFERLAGLVGRMNLLLAALPICVMKIVAVRPARPRGRVQRE